MRIAIGADHRGVRYKTIVLDVVEKLGHSVQDFGPDSEESVDYPDYALPLARSVACGENDAGILICASGIGMSIAANRVRGVRAALCVNEMMAESSRRHNNANVLCIGQSFLDEQTCCRIVEKWLTTDFEGGRHARRLAKIDEPGDSGCSGA
jgi:ribose 5-phosphate isomerase B